MSWLFDRRLGIPVTKTPLDNEGVTPKGQGDDRGSVGIPGCEPEFSLQAQLEKAFAVITAVFRSESLQTQFVI